MQREPRRRQGERLDPISRHLNAYNVTWYWVYNLGMYLEGEGDDPIEVWPHRVHDEHTARPSGQIFYGSFTLVTADGQVHHAEEIESWTPTADEHTEPQYFAWVVPKITAAMQRLGNVIAVIYEVNQTNTPCSQQDCRPAIYTTWLTQFPVLCIARMNAYFLYESQPPEVGLTLDVAREMAKNRTNPPTITEASVVHRVPEHMTE